MRPVDRVLHGNSLASSNQAHLLLLASHHVHCLYRYVNPLQRKLSSIISDISQGEKSQKPAVDNQRFLVHISIRKLSFMVNVIPKLNVGLSFVSLDKFFENRSQSLYVAFKLSIHIVLLQGRQLFHYLLPIIESASHVDVLDATGEKLSNVLEVFLEGVHDDCCGEDGEKFGCSRKIALELFSHSFDCVFSDGDDHFFEEIWPLIKIIRLNLNHKLFLALMTHKGTLQLLSVIIDILAKVKHDGCPDIIWSDHEVSMIDVCLVESREQSIATLFSQLAAFLIAVKFLHFFGIPQLSSILVFTLFLFLRRQLLDGNSLVSLKIGPDLNLGILCLASHHCQFFKDACQKGSFQQLVNILLTPQLVKHQIKYIRGMLNQFFFIVSKSISQIWYKRLIWMNHIVRLCQAQSGRRRSC